MLSHKAMMAASMDEPPMSEVDLDEDARRAARARELERYHHLPVHHLHKEKDLHEVVLPSTPSARRHVTNGSHSTEKELHTEIKQVHPTQGQHPATVSVQEQHVVQRDETKPKKSKRVQIFSGFGKKAHASDAGEGGDHTHDLAYEKNGAGLAPHRFVDGQGHSTDYDKPTICTVYLNYLKRPPGILRIVQLLVGVIVCAAVNAERCIPHSLTGIVCGSASSPLWYGYFGGQGYVLFVGILFILGNFVLIFYHICTRRGHKSSVDKTKSQGLMQDKILLTELAYDALAVIMYIIAASVESWYASWKTIDLVPSDLIYGVKQESIRNVYRPQWIAAAVFAWINVILYAVHLAVRFLFR